VARDAGAFIRERLPLGEVPGCGGLRLHLAGPRSGLSRLVPPGGVPPYWAHAWPGGVALARHLLAEPGRVAGRAVVDLGAGSGLVAVAAMRAGAASALALDPDPLALVAVGLNAAANGVAVGAARAGAEGLAGALDRLGGGAVVLCGDVFYDAGLAGRVAAALDAAAGRAEVLVGDIGRASLPRDRLEPLACHPVRDLGDPPGAPLREGCVFRWRAA
jgi:predicted nicotinamide N-methyase